MSGQAGREMSYLPGRTNKLSHRSTGHSLLDLRELLLLPLLLPLLPPPLLPPPLALVRCPSPAPIVVPAADGVVDVAGVVEVRSSSTGTHRSVECSGNRASRFIPGKGRPEVGLEVEVEVELESRVGVLRSSLVS